MYQEILNLTEDENFSLAFDTAYKRSILNCSDLSHKSHMKRASIAIALLLKEKGEPINEYPFMPVFTLINNL